MQNASPLRSAIEFVHGCFPTDVYRHVHQLAGETFVMTTITRRANEGIAIGEDVFVEVLEVEADCVRLGIHCPSRTPSYWEQTLYINGAEEAEPVGMTLEV